MLIGAILLHTLFCCFRKNDDRFPEEIFFNIGRLENGGEIADIDINSFHVTNSLCRFYKLTIIFLFPVNATLVKQISWITNVIISKLEA